MSIRPWVVVEAPDRRGLRRVTKGGKTVGSAWSPGELRKLLRRLGFPQDIDLEDSTSICWRGGGSGTWPDRPWRRYAVIVLMLAGLLASMALNAVVGWPDASGALTFAQRISGVLFVLTGVVEGAAAIAVLDYWRRRQFRASGAIVLLGALIALATDSVLLFMWLEEREYTYYLLVFLPLWCWSLWAVFLLVHERSWKGIPQPKRFAAGVVVTAVLSGVSLAYSTMYQPAAAPMHFTLKAEFGKSRADRNHPFVHVPLTLSMKNTGGIPVYIMNDIYTVRGREAKYSESGDLATEWRESLGRRGGGEGEAELHVGNLRYTPISSGHFYGPGNRLDVGQEYTLKRVFQLPEDTKYDTVSVRLQILYMRKDRGKLDAEEFGTPHYTWNERDKYFCLPEWCGEQLIYSGRLWHNNNLINVTRKPRYVTAIWSPGGRNFVSSISSVDYSSYPSDAKEVKRELDRYGAAKVSANSVVSVAELLRYSGVSIPRRPR
ncbi:Yip1 family protein [Streptomyces spongiae]|uniref:Yip1 family protein n=1 Tax=Streptomyces spongiae TaxID=565072 RepID=UPI0018840DE2|nr:Yip1 family protein [Streptomyces spongiae]